MIEQQIQDFIDEAFDFDDEATEEIVEDTMTYLRLRCHELAWEHANRAVNATTERSKS